MISDCIGNIRLASATAKYSPQVINGLISCDQYPPALKMEFAGKFWRRRLHLLNTLFMRYILISY
jgi:hypothetical protein